MQGDTSNSVYKMWESIVADLSDMSITNETDRLPALAGIASLIAPSIGGKYLAGLWEAHLAQSLTWQRRSYQHPCLSVRTTQPSTIPSWSWASIRSNDKRFSTRIVFISRDLKSDTDFRILEASCHASDANPFGTVFGGKIQIRARSMQAQLCHRYVDVPDGVNDHVIFFQDSDDSEVFLPDISCTHESSVQDESVLVLLLGSMKGTLSNGKRDSGMRDVVLILRKSGKEGWERIGVVIAWANIHHFRNKAVSIVTLV